MFDILQGDMTRSKVILTFTCLKMYIARSGDTSGSRTTLLMLNLMIFVVPYSLCFKLKPIFALHEMFKLSKLLGGGGTICLPPNIFIGGATAPPPPPPQDRRICPVGAGAGWESILHVVAGALT